MSFPTSDLELFIKQVEVSPELVMMSHPDPENPDQMVHFLMCRHSDGRGHLFDGLVLGDNGRIVGEIEMPNNEVDDEDGEL